MSKPQDILKPSRSLRHDPDRAYSIVSLLILDLTSRLPLRLRKNAVQGGKLQRNQHIKDIAEHGRMTWQINTGYNLRSLVEVQIGRWKQVLEGGLQARHFDNQACEASIGTKALNRMTTLGRAKIERVC